MDAIKEVVQEKYGEAALRARGGQKASCGCGTSGCCGADPITSNLYDEAQAAAIPAEAMLASLGCGNPTALAELKPGETVLDLGSGGGIDVLLSARRVGPDRQGLRPRHDRRDAGAGAREPARRPGVTNVEFLKGEIEHIPLPDNSVDVIISNCVINLSADKDRVLAEAFRVLKPGGRFAVSDVVVRGETSRQTFAAAWSSGSAASPARSRRAATATSWPARGSSSIDVEPTRIYRAADAQQFLDEAGLSDDATLAQIDGRFMSAFVRARKPAAAKDCCGPTCCT